MKSLHATPQDYCTTYTLSPQPQLFGRWRPALGDGPFSREIQRGLSRRAETNKVDGPKVPEHYHYFFDEFITNAARGACDVSRGYATARRAIEHVGYLMGWRAIQAAEAVHAELVNLQGSEKADAYLSSVGEVIAIAAAHCDALLERKRVTKLDAVNALREISKVAKAIARGHLIAFGVSLHQPSKLDDVVFDLLGGE